LDWQPDAQSLTATACRSPLLRRGASAGIASAIRVKVVRLALSSSDPGSAVVVATATIVAELSALASIVVPPADFGLRNR
jgi:hypothetical protein